MKYKLSEFGLNKQSLKRKIGEISCQTLKTKIGEMLDLRTTKYTLKEIEFLVDGFYGNIVKKSNQSLSLYYSQKNKEKYKKRRLYYCMSARVRQSLKNGKDGEKWTKLVGYSVADLKIHLKDQFNDIMNWNNYGDIWEIDHIKPIASFNIDSCEDDDFKKCWSLNNLRP